MDNKIGHITSLIKKEKLLKFGSGILVYLADHMVHFYVVLKAYRLILYTKIAFDQLPMYNPYTWPLSSIRALVDPYLFLWSKIIPSLRIGTITYDMSNYVALEFLTSTIKSLYLIRLILLAQSDRIIAKL